jgi:acetylglutamate kinase
MLNILKIGGNVLDSEKDKLEFLQKFSALKGPKILIHGGGKIASEIGLKMGIIPQMHEGRRITDSDTLHLVVQVYGGLINKGLVAQLQSMGCDAIGLTGADGNLLPATKRPVRDVDFGWVGDVQVDKIATGLLKSLLDQHLTPVIAPLSHDGQGNLLNTNADAIASSLAIAMAKEMEVSLSYVFEQPGVMGSINNPETIIAHINKTKAEALKNQGIISGGMIPKIDTALACIEAGVKMVRIVHHKDFTEPMAGTRISL